MDTPKLGGQGSKVRLIQRNRTHQAGWVACSGLIGRMIDKAPQVRLTPFSIGPSAQNKLVPHAIDPVRRAQRPGTMSAQVQEANHFAQERFGVMRFLLTKACNLGLKHRCATQ